MRKGESSKTSERLGQTIYKMFITLEKRCLKLNHSYISSRKYLKCNKLINVGLHVNSEEIQTYCYRNWQSPELCCPKSYLSLCIHIFLNIFSMLEPKFSWIKALFTFMVRDVDLMLMFIYFSPPVSIISS